MRFMHLADLHLGKVVNEFSMEEDQAYILEEILGMARDVDAVLIAGDVYDKCVPPEWAVRLLDGFLTRLAGMGKTVLMVSGNHDSDDRLQFGSGLFAARGVHIAGRYEGELKRVTLTDEAGPVDVYLLPFVKASAVRDCHPDAQITDYSTAVRAVISHAAIDPARRSVMVAHQFVTGEQPPALSGSETIREETVGTLERVSCGEFDLFDYVALGHIHGPQAVGRETCRYAGSPLKYSRSEVWNAKSVPIITFGAAKGDVTVEQRPLVPLRDMRVIHGELEKLLTTGKEEGSEDYFFAELTDENRAPNAMDRLRARYPNMMGLEYVQRHRQSAAQRQTAGRPKKTFEDIITGFFREVVKHELTDEEKAVLTEAAKEGGVNV